MGATEVVASQQGQILDEWTDKLVKLGTEYGQELTSKVKVAVLCGMMPKDLQDKDLDACAVNWDETTNSEGWPVVHEDQGLNAERRKGKAEDGRTEADGSGPGGRVERVVRRLVRRVQ